MKKLYENNYLKTLLILSPFLLIASLVFYINRELGSSFINISDSAIFLTINEARKRFFSLWTENNLGYRNSLYVGINFFSHLYSLILLKLNLSIKWMELVIYFITYTGIFYSSWYAFYLVQKKLFNQNNNIFLPFFTAFFYSYNIYNISLLGIIDQLFLLQVLYPYLLYVLITLFNKELDLKFILLSAFLLGFTMNVPIFSFAIYLCLFLPFILLKKNAFSIKNTILFISVFIIANLLTSPLIYALIHGYVSPDPFSNVKNNLVGYIFPPFGLMGIFQFFFHWTVIYLNTYFNLYFKSKYGLASSYMIWILILTSLIVYWQEIKNKRVLLFLMFSLVLAMFLAKGAQKPFDELNTWMYNSNPLFVIFRTSGSKFGSAVMLILSFLILYTLNIIKNKFLFTSLIVVIFMQTWVFFNPVNFIGENTYWWNRPVVSISQDYRDLISYINTSKKSGAILFYPGLSSGHYDLKNGVKFSFQDVLGKYIDRPIIYPDTNLQFSLAKKNIDKVTYDFNPELVGQSSVRYILIRQDFDVRLLNEKAIVGKALEIIRSKGYSKTFTSKLFAVYEVQEKYFRDLITIRTPKREYTPNFKKIAPYHYLVKAKVKDLLSNQIIFRNNFHPDWVILDLEKKGLKAKQILVDNFANGWLISLLDEKNPPNPNQDIELDIYFYPQKIFFGLSVVSIISIICFGSLTVYLFLKKR